MVQGVTVIFWYQAKVISNIRASTMNSSQELKRNY